MEAVAVTELKSNFKIYAEKASNGNPVLIKRPKNHPNLVMIDEASYIRERRLLEYFSRLNGYKSVDELLSHSPIDSYYSSEFIKLFGSISEEDLVRPSQGEFSDDVVREVI